MLRTIFICGMCVLKMITCILFQVLDYTQRCLVVYQIQTTGFINVVYRYKMLQKQTFLKMLQKQSYPRISCVSYNKSQIQYTAHKSAHNLNSRNVSPFHPNSHDYIIYIGYGVSILWKNPIYDWINNR